MNGRIYDPLLARFVQADPTLQFPEYSQGYNRYAYVLNNPMTYTDPSGYFVKWVMQKTGTWDLLRAIASVPILDAMVTIGLNFIPGCQGWCSAMYVAAFQAAKTYAVTGSFGAGLRAGAISLATPGGADFGNAALNFVVDGINGGIFSVLQGGKFGNGFISSAVGNQMAGAGGSNPYMRIAVSAMVGGTISAVTGGKFLNGAVSGAFATTLKEYSEGNIFAGTCSKCNKAYVGDLEGKSYAELQKLRDGLIEARDVDGYDVTEGLKKITAKMKDGAFTKEELQEVALNTAYRKSQQNTAHNMVVAAGYGTGIYAAGRWGLAETLGFIGNVSDFQAIVNVATGNGELSDYVGIATFGYGKGMTAAMQKSGLDTKGMEVFNSIKTDVMGCITGGQGVSCPLRW